MKTVLMSLILMSAMTSHAQTNAPLTDCRISIDSQHDSMDVQDHFDEGHTGLKRLTRILENKGYQVVEKDQNAPYQISVSAGAGYSCDSGLSFLDYVMMPEASHMVFHGLNGQQIHGHFEGRTVAVVNQLTMVRRVLSWVRHRVPNCGAIQP